ncbi:MAG: polyprenyl synthetase family protein [Bacilli bacterium]
MTTQFSSFSKTYKNEVEAVMREYLDGCDIPTTLRESMRYSLDAGGKRIRPLLVFATMEALEQPPARALALAAAVEMLHTYSLIHDDLPSMDDDDLRRGKPTNHIVFGEATAVLAGDALLTESFGMLTSLVDEGVEPHIVVALVRMFTEAVGAQGMIAGQMLDMEAEGKRVELDELEHIHRNKTGKLLAFSIEGAAVLAGANGEERALLRTFADLLGVSFQIQDDLLDVLGDEAKIGKRVGSDVVNEKSTYTSLLGIEETKRILREKVSAANETLNALNKRNDAQLRALLALVAERDH